MQKAANATDALRLRRAEIAREIENLRHEDAELEIAEAALARLTGRQTSSRAGATSTSHGFSGPSDPLAAKGSPRSQRDAVLGVLRDAPEVWLRSRDIIEISRRRWGFAIPEKSLRPLLTVMKRDGVVVRRGRLLATPERAGAPERRDTRSGRAGNANRRD